MKIIHLYFLLNHKQWGLAKFVIMKPLFKLNFYKISLYFALAVDVFWKGFASRENAYM